MPFTSLCAAACLGSTFIPQTTSFAIVVGRRRRSAVSRGDKRYDADCLHELTKDAAIWYVHEHTGCEPAEMSAEELGGGVSNRVVLVEGPGIRWVLKQALANLRV